MKNTIDFDKFESMVKELNTDIDNYISSFERIKCIMEIFADLEYFTGSRTTDKVMGQYFVTARENEKLESCVRDFIHMAEMFLIISKPVPGEIIENIKLNE